MCVRDGFERWEGERLEAGCGVRFKCLVRRRRRGRLPMVWGSLGQATGGYPSLSESRRGGAGGRACAEVVLRAGGVSE